MSIEQQLIIFLFTTLGASFGIAFGGGSFVVLPVLFLMGVDPKIAVATNVAAAVAQLITGAIMFGRHKKVHYRLATKATPFYLLGGIIGAFALINIDPTFLKSIVAMAIIFFALFSIFRKKHVMNAPCSPAVTKTPMAYPLLVLVGTYQVLTTAGAGTILTFIFIYLFDLNLKCSIYTRQFVTLPTMVVGAGILIQAGLVNWLLFIPLVLGRTAGAIIGSELVMHTQRKKLSVAFSVIVVLMAIKTLLG
ncbi:MAG: sulfite exporter TauE/SafE family protein [Patescibacteria group bacterium]